MQKGFLHIVEIIIVSIIAFLVIFQFSYIPKQQTDWKGMKLFTQTNDILFTLDRKGVDWFNSTQISASLNLIIPSNIVYALKIKNSMKSNINVGCICSPAEIFQLRMALKYFEINGHVVNFNVVQIPPSSIDFSYDYDVIVDFDYDLANNYTQVKQFLSAGKGIVEFRHLQQSEIDAVQTDFFGINWNTTTKSSDGTSIEFYSNRSSEPYYNIYKYFHNIPVYQMNFTYGTDGWTFGGGWSASGGTYIGSSGASRITSLYSNPIEDRYSLRVSFMPAAGNSPNVTLIAYTVWQDSVFVIFDVSAGNVTVWANESGSTVFKGSSTYPLTTQTWYDVKIIPLANSSLEIYVNGNKTLTSNSVNIPDVSSIGLGVDNGKVYFDNIRVTLSENHAFSNTFPLLAGENVWPADDNIEKVVLLQKSTQLPACIINDNIIGDKGRTAWLASGVFINQEIKNMLRTLVVWAAGDENEVISNNIKVPVVASLYKTYDQDMFEPVEVVLSMGNLYQ